MSAAVSERGQSGLHVTKNCSYELCIDLFYLCNSTKIFLFKRLNVCKLRKGNQQLHSGRERDHCWTRRVP